jgi:hypothetical protein
MIQIPAQASWWQSRRERQARHRGRIPENEELLGFLKGPTGDMIVFSSRRVCFIDGDGKRIVLGYDELSNVRTNIHWFTFGWGTDQAGGTDWSTNVELTRTVSGDTMYLQLGYPVGNNVACHIFEAVQAATVLLSYTPRSLTLPRKMIGEVGRQPNGLVLSGPAWRMCDIRHYVC